MVLRAWVKVTTPLKKERGISTLELFLIFGVCAALILGTIGASSDDISDWWTDTFPKKRHGSSVVSSE